MPDLTYDIIVVPTYDVNTLSIMDGSTYSDVPLNPYIKITPPGYTPVYIPFVINSLNVFNSTDLEITTAGNEEPLPDGIYCFTYIIDDNELVEKSILRVDKLQERFDEAFLTLDMMECDRAIKTQSMVDLNTIYFFIQGAIASANNCAIADSSKLYIQAGRMLEQFIRTNCNCSGNNYVINFQ